jgi:tetratricopeptide (TPR) repeat protein/transcriptional regulator with XRE-family HTH domain
MFSFGAWVRRRRKTLDLTQAALADRVGCAEVTIRKLEGDVFRPSRGIAERLADCLNVPPHERTRFLQVARGERSVDHLPTPTTLTSVPSPATTEVSVPVAPLPLDTIPPPAPLPPGSRMPLSRNPLFVGREVDLCQVARALHVGRTAAIGQMEIAAATGLGGIGKTQLACQFIHHYGQYFAGGVFWLSFADPAAVPAEVAACGGADGMQLRPDFGLLPLDEQVKLVLAAWESTSVRLLVFDNCEDEALLQQWRPKHGDCRVLLTSRRRHWDVVFDVHPLPLDVLPRTESLALLRQFRPDLPANDADLDAIADVLGDLPLALHLAGSFLAKYRHALTPAQYLQRLHVPTILSDRSLQAAGLSPTQHVQHVARTFEQSYARLDPADPVDALARTLLAHVASFAPGEPLSRSLLLQTLALPEEDVERTLLAEDALTRLIDLGLLDTTAAGSLRLHRLLVAFVQAVLVDEVSQVAVETAILRVVDALNERGDPRAVLAIQPHLRCITEAAQSRGNVCTAGLCHALGAHLLYLGVYPEAQRYFEQALAIRQQVLGSDDPDTANSLDKLGMVCYAQGQYAAAQRSLEQALAIRQRLLAPDHRDTTKSLTNLGLVCYAQGQYAQAQDALEQALAINQQALGLDHPDAAWNLTNLGLVYYAQGQYAQAQDALEQALAIRQRLLAPDENGTARSLTALGEVLRAQVEMAQDHRDFEQAWAIRERVLGPDNNDTAWSLDNLAVVCYAQGQYAQAKVYVEQALAIRERVLGPDHRDTAWSLNNLGLVCYAQGQYTAAQSYLEQSLAINQQALGLDHPDTAWNFTNLGLICCAQGQYAAAQSYLEQSLAINQQALGLNHPDTATSFNNLGTVLAKQEQYAAAQQSYEQALAIRQRVLGPDHPDTARSLKGLGELLHAQGKATQARHYLESALATFEQRLSLQHPDMEQTLRTLATLDVTPHHDDT